MFLRYLVGSSAADVQRQSERAGHCSQGRLTGHRRMPVPIQEPALELHYLQQHERLRKIGPVPYVTYTCLIAIQI